MFGWPVKAERKVCFRVRICVVLAHPPGVPLVWSWARLGVGVGGQGLKDRVTLLWDEALN